MSNNSKSVKNKLSKKAAAIIKNHTLCNSIRENISNSRIFRFKTVDYSMMPAITNGEVITLVPLGEKPLAIGDIVAFEHPITEDLTVYRIIAIQNGNYILKGDNNCQIVNRIPIEKIIARVTGVEKKKFKYFCINLIIKVKLYLKDLDLYLLPFLCGEKNGRNKKSTIKS